MAHTTEASPTPIPVTRRYALPEMSQVIPTFDEWVSYCFEFGYADFHTFPDNQSDEYVAIEQRERRFGAIPNPTLTEYATRLFSSPAFVADLYNDSQIADATWFIFGVGSSYFHYFRETDVSRDAQVALMRSVSTMYTDLFDCVCNNRSTEPDAEFASKSAVDIAVYMIWDMDCIECPLYSPKVYEHLVEPSFEILETALFRCRTASCKMSALHGLGHIHRKHQVRTEALIDRFLLMPNQPTHLREYAIAARSGGVQ